MKINDFSNDEVMLRTVAQMLTQEFAKLDRIGSSIKLNVFNGLVPQDKLVETFWPYLGEALEEDGGNGICRADIFYSTVDGSDNIDMVHVTGIELKRINDAEHRQIQEETEARRKAAE